MGEVIILSEYVKRKEIEELKRMREELHDLVSGMDEQVDFCVLLPSDIDYYGQLSDAFTYVSSWKYSPSLDWG